MPSQTATTTPTAAEDVKPAEEASATPQEDVSALPLEERVERANQLLAA